MLFDWDFSLFVFTFFDDLLFIIFSFSRGGFKTAILFCCLGKGVVEMGGGMFGTGFLEGFNCADELLDSSLFLDSLMCLFSSWVDCTVLGFLVGSGCTGCSDLILFLGGGEGGGRGHSCHFAPILKPLRDILGSVVLSSFLL